MSRIDLPARRGMERQASKPMIETPEITQTTEQQTAAIHIIVSRAKIQEVMEPAIGELMAAVTAQGIGPTGPLLSYHLRMDPEVFDFEISMPVSAPVTATGRVRQGLLPAAKVARTIYHGPYEKLGAGWGELIGWIEAGGHQPGPNLWESYLTGPESSPDPSKWRTELNRPLLD